MKHGAETLPSADIKPLERAEALGAIAENAIVTEGLYNRHSCGTLGRQGKAAQLGNTEKRSTVFTLALTVSQH
jgi:hypothetical protein